MTVSPLLDFGPFGLTAKADRLGLTAKADRLGRRPKGWEGQGEALYYL